MEQRRTFWLYYGSQIVGSVRADAHASEQDVRSQALASHERVPLCDWPNENPSERRFKILCADVRTFPGGN